MSKAKLTLSVVSILAISAGVAAIAVGAFLLKKLDDHAFGDPVAFYAAIRRGSWIASRGSVLCLAGSLGFALMADHRRGFRAARNSAFSCIASAILGLFVFPIHYPSGAVYFDILAVTLGTSLIFLSVASARWMLYKNRSI
jgi:hypothetical protein